MIYMQHESLFAYHDLIAAIVSALENRDINTFHHSTRVSNISERICRQLKLSKAETELIHIAADLHDIGKIGIPDCVLLKQGALNHEEWEIIKKHSTIGYEIIGKVGRFDDISDIIRHHHERWDGKGYPDHLSGFDIPLGSRIIAVADSIDAMLSDRSYRKGMTGAECYNEIAKNSGIMYDSKIADCVLENWQDVLTARNKE